LKTAKDLITEADFEAFEASQVCEREYIHGYLAVETAKMMNIFQEEKSEWETANSHISIASREQVVQLKDWQDAMARNVAQLERNINELEDEPDDRGDVHILSELGDEHGDVAAL
jgi:thymidylate synthase